MLEIILISDIMYSIHIHNADYQKQWSLSDTEVIDSFIQNDGSRDNDFKQVYK